MITRTSTMTLNLNGTMLQDCARSALLFFDIETTGFTAGTSSLYLIGAVSWQKESWLLHQWFAQSPEEEADVLRAFLDFSKSFKQLVHFNGDRFDLPYLKDKCHAFGMEDSLSSLISRDLFRMVRPLKTLLKLNALNQRSLEEYLGIYRRDPYSGGELIQVYKEYVQYHTEGPLQKLLLHNHDDLQGMLDILPILSYQTFLSGSFQVTGCDIMGDSLILHGRLPLFLPRVFSYGNPWLYLTGRQDKFSVEVHGVRDTLKYFFPDYKNYYYLPEEDVALHKSVAAYVDKEHREPAKASTCYNKKKGFYLPQFESVFAPIFKKDYADRQQYFPCTDAFTADKEKLHLYLCHLLDHL